MHQTAPIVRYWLIACAALVTLMVLVGGLTRLTESGLSIVEWKLVHGTLPPLSTESWNREFSEYQRSPEFLKKNHWMELHDFKRIYWLEYLHRLLGRVIGLAVLLPFFWFAARSAMPRWLTYRMGIVSILVVLQGLVGWIMVKSGLVDDPRVSPYKLAFHLTLAFLIFSLMLLSILELKWPKGTAPANTARTASGLMLIAILLQIVMGALVAGLDAGLTYNSFPLMDGKWVPDSLLALSPPLVNFFENVATVQFQHRLWGTVLLGLGLVWLWVMRRTGANYAARSLACACVLLLFGQYVLGVLTLVYGVPIHLASLHQMMALAVLAVAVAAWHFAARQPTFTRTV